MERGGGKKETSSPLGHGGQRVGGGERDHEKMHQIKKQGKWLRRS